MAERLLYHYHFSFYRDDAGQVWADPSQSNFPKALLELTALVGVTVVAHQVLEKQDPMRQAPEGLEWIDAEALLDNKAKPLEMPTVALVRWPSRLGQSIAAWSANHKLRLYVMVVGHLWAPTVFFHPRYILRDLAVLVLKAVKTWRFVRDRQKLRALGAIPVVNGKGLQKVYQRSSLGWPDVVTTVNRPISRAMVEAMAEPPAAKHGADTLRLVMVCCIDRHKRVHRVLDALRAVRASGCENVQLELVGPFRDRAYETWLKREYLGDDTLNATVCYRGAIPFGPQLLDVYRDADLFVHLGAFEGNPRSAMESLAMGTPVATIDVGSMLEFVEHDVNGWCLPDADAATLTSFFLFCAHDLQRVRRWAKSCRARQASFLLETQIEALALRLGL